MDGIARRAILEQKRLDLLSRTTREERVAEMGVFLQELSDFGKRNFPRAPERWEDEEEK